MNQAERPWNTDEQARRDAEFGESPAGKAELARRLEQDKQKYAELRAKFDAGERIMMGDKDLLIHFVQGDNEMRNEDKKAYLDRIFGSRGSKQG